MLAVFNHPVMADTDVQRLNGFKSLGIEADLLIEGLAVSGRVSDIYDIRSPRCSVVCFRIWLEKHKTPVFIRNNIMTFVMKKRVVTILIDGHSAGFVGRMIISDFSRGIGAYQEMPFGKLLGVKVLDVGRSNDLDNSRTILMSLPSWQDVQRMVRHAVNQGYRLSVIEPDKLFFLTKGKDEIWMQVRAVTGVVSLLVIRAGKPKA